MNRTLVEKARCIMIFDAKLTAQFWAEAINTATYLANRLPIAQSKRTPEEIWTGKRPNVSHLRVFGSTAMAHVPKHKNAAEVNDYSANDNQFYLFLEGDKIEVEELANNHTSNVNMDDGPTDIDTAAGTSADTTADLTADEATGAMTDENVICVDDSFVGCDTDVTIDDPNDVSYRPPDFVMRETANAISNRRPATRSNPSSFIAMTGVYDPVTVQDALSSEQAADWKHAMQEEYSSLIENDTWILVRLPGERVINNRWVFKTKTTASGEIERLKARLVVKDCGQMKGIDYEETFSPVVRYGSIRYLLAIATRHNLRIDQMDAVTAFLHGKLTDEIYMKQPELFTDGTDRVCRLKKSLYGLKQASRVWNGELNKALRLFGMKRLESDSCIYIILWLMGGS